MFDLMVSASLTISDASARAAWASPGQCTREGYTQMHMRLSRAMETPVAARERRALGDEFDEKEARRQASLDWADDIGRFSQTSHLCVWLNALRQQVSCCGVFGCVGWLSTHATA